MLVKFLSFAISVIGTARYKTVLLSCLALVLSLTGITAMVLRGSGAQHDVSSTVQKQSKDGVGTQDLSPQLHGQKQQTKDEAPSQSQAKPSTDNSNSSSSQSTDNSSTSNTKQPTTAAFDFTLGKTPTTLAVDSTSDPITITTSDNSAVNWTATVDNDSNARVTISQATAASTNLQIQVSKNVPSGTQLKVIVTAHDSTRNINLPKTFTITVQ